MSSKLRLRRYYHIATQALTGAVTLLLAVPAPSVASDNAGWAVEFPQTERLPAQKWLQSAGWEEQRGSARRWYITNGVLHTIQNDDSTAIGTKRGFPISAKKFPMLQFEFKVTELPRGADLHKKATEDSALRIFVAFDKGGGVFSPPNTLGYAFGEKEEINKVITSERFDQVKYIPVAKAPDGLGRWITVERNLIADYAGAFGTRNVPAIRAVVIKSDANNTETRARAQVRAIRFVASKRRP